MENFIGFPRIGGKHKLTGKLRNILNGLGYEGNYKYFIDGTAGGLRITLNINKSYFENVVCNDIDPGVVALAAILVSERKIEELKSYVDDLLEETTSPKKLFNMALNELDNAFKQEDFNEADTLRLAAFHLITTYSQSKNNSRIYDKDKFIGNFGKYSKNKKHHMLKKYNSFMDKVRISKMDIFKILEVVGGDKRVLIYLDPPYHPHTMSGVKNYRSNFTVEDHRRLCNIINKESFKATVVLSGWDNDDYKELLENGEEVEFYKYFLDIINVSSSTKQNTSPKSKEEFIWCNREIPYELVPKKNKQTNSCKFSKLHKLMKMVDIRFE